MPKTKGRHLKRHNKKRGRSRKGRGQLTRLQAGGKNLSPAFVGSPWNGGDTNTWGVTNHYAYNPQGSGSGDPLDIILGTRAVAPGNMVGGRRRRRKRTLTKRRPRKSLKGGEIKDDLNGPLNYLQNQIDRSIAGGSKKRRRSRKKSKRKPRKKTGKKRRKVRKGRKSRRRSRKRLRGGYKGDLAFQNLVNAGRNVVGGLGNVVHGFRGYPQQASPYPNDQPGMEPAARPISMPADVETLYKNAQTHVGGIGST